MASEIPWTSIRALSFDIYGTLIDWNGGIVSAARNTALGPYLPKGDDELLKRFGAHAADLERNRPLMRKSDLNAEALHLYAQELKIVESGKLSQSQVDAAGKEFGGSIGSYEAFPDTVEAMQRLKKHYKLIALSNVDHASLEGTLKNGVGGNPFDACYIAEDIGTYKPHENNFNYLFEHMKQDFDIERGDLCHVAQSVFHDHPTTKKLGIPSVWIDRYDVLESSGKSAEDMQADFGYKFRVRSLKEVADIVDQAFAKSS